MDLDTIIRELNRVVKGGGRPLQRRVCVNLLASAVAKLEEARGVVDDIVCSDALTIEIGTALHNRASNFLCEEAEYCDGCTCRFTRRMNRCVVDRMPRTVGAATRGESATLCSACHAVATAKGGAR